MHPAHYHNGANIINYHGATRNDDGATRNDNAPSYDVAAYYYGSATYNPPAHNNHNAAYRHT
jgi:hypothetical protein